MGDSRQLAPYIGLKWGMHADLSVIAGTYALDAEARQALGKQTAEKWLRN